MADNEITFYLTPWQKRMIKDFLPITVLKGLRIDKIKRMILKNPKKLCLASYKIPPEGIRRDDWLIYLTDEQMHFLSDELRLRVPISSINITSRGLAGGEIRFA